MTALRITPEFMFGSRRSARLIERNLYVYKHGLSVTNLRIGNVADAPIDVRRLSIWLHPEDLVQLIRIGLKHPDIRH